MSRFCLNPDCAHFRNTRSSALYVDEAGTHCGLCGDVLVDEEGYRVARRHHYLERTFRRVSRRRLTLLVALISSVVTLGVLGPYADTSFGLSRGTTAGFVVLLGVVGVVVFGLREGFRRETVKRDRTPDDGTPVGGHAPDIDLDLGSGDFGGGGDGGGD